jgi:hypothetical protein
MAKSGKIAKRFFHSFFAPFCLFYFTKKRLNRFAMAIAKVR